MYGNTRQDKTYEKMFTSILVIIVKTWKLKSTLIGGQIKYKQSKTHTHRQQSSGYQGVRGGVIRE